MTPDQVEAIRERSCTTKSKWSAKRARQIAAEMQRKGADVRPYRCVFDNDHWHVGHPLSMAGVETLAALIRSRNYPEAG